MKLPVSWLREFVDVPGAPARLGASFHGNATSQTDRLAAALLAARRIVIRGVPEMCTGSVSSGVA